MATSRAVVALVTCAALIPTSEGALRGQQVLSSNDIVLAELGMALEDTGSTAEVEARVANMTDALRPVYYALPRSEEGYLEPSAVRYLLHRYFIDRDGWFVQGSDASGEAANNSLPDVVLKGGALAGLLSERLAARGLSLREVSVLATALETLAKSETVKRLHAAYRIVGLSHRKDHATEAELQLVLDVYMQMYTLGQNHDVTTWMDVNETWKKIYQVYPLWDEFKRWVHDVRLEALASVPEKRANFHGQVRALEEVQHRYGRWQDQECLLIKKALLQHVTPGTGRIPLGAFYRASLPGGWQPNESEEYLKHIGALDETDPSSPSVVIPNYFDAPSNCATPSKFYSVCCISECESLLGQLERQLGTPNALPQQIVEIVEHLPSATVEVPRSLPAQLLKRLESVADMHGGHAPLHGRLFRQWMHHAFPAECSFPALSTTTKVMSPHEFTVQTGHSALADPADLQRSMQKKPKNATDTTRLSPSFEVEATASFPLREELPWSDDEELFITCSAGSKQEVQAPSLKIARGALLLAIAASVVFLITRVRRSPQDPSLLPA